MASIQVTPQNMIKISTDIESKISEWQAAVTKIYTLHAQMDAMWDGNANDSFNAIFKEDEAKFNNLTRMMQEYAAAIKTAANNYITSEEEVQGIVTKR